MIIISIPLNARHSGHYFKVSLRGIQKQKFKIMVSRPRDFLYILNYLTSN